jgi:hypothetical protein
MIFFLDFTLGEFLNVREIATIYLYYQIVKIIFVCFNTTMGLIEALWSDATYTQSPDLGVGVEM